MSEPFIAEVRIFAGNFAPRGWAFCNGQLLPISQNTALFSLIGTVFGGDGRTTTGLPDLQGRAPMHPGNGPGLTTRRLGERGGVEQETLAEQQLPNHNHVLNGSVEDDDSTLPTGNAYGVQSVVYAPATSALTNMADTSLPFTGGSLPHNNMQPYLVLNYIIALTGLYPSRS